MIKDLIKSLYLIVVNLLFSLFKIRSLQNRIVFYASFEQNTIYILKELLQRNDDIDIIVICKDSIRHNFIQFQSDSLKVISLNNKLDFIYRLYYSAVSKIVVMDNYYPELSAMNFKRGVECIQIWHANGAIKSFGLEDRNTHSRTSMAMHRFRKVYSRFTKIVVGSEEMAAVFKKAFGVKDDVFLKTGVPRTDLFFDEPVLESHRKHFFDQYPAFKGKKIILYTPTFRDDSDHSYDIDFQYIQQHLRDEYIFILKMHPATKQKLNVPKGMESIFKIVDPTIEVNQLLSCADVLITDYSSIPFEYCLLRKPMIFFAYDLEKYILERGIWNEYEQFVPGPVVKSTSELVNEIVLSKDWVADNHYINFCKDWNKYSTGHASKLLVDFILKKVA